MLNERVARKYLRLALGESSVEVAKEIFAVALRCRELERKNRRLIKFAGRAEIMSNEHNREWRRTLGRAPQTWEQEFETGWATYLRRTAQLICNFESRRKIERAAEAVFELEVRNKALRETLDQIMRSHKDEMSWREWIESYRAEKEEQDECGCCGMGCHMCGRCREYHNKRPPFSEAA